MLLKTVPSNITVMIALTNSVNVGLLETKKVKIIGRRRSSWCKKQFLISGTLYCGECRYYISCIHQKDKDYRPQGTV